MKIDGFILICGPDDRQKEIGISFDEHNDTYSIDLHVLLKWIRKNHPQILEEA